MYAKKTTIINRTGLHARTANEFVKAAKSFSSEITVKKLDERGETVKSGSAKSVVHVVTMILNKGTPVELTAQGPDEREAVENLVSLIEEGFNDL
ncbi:MAG: HPr family phosphocarrier protein [Spirochaetales bacterium]|jgi:phosphocarrier protein|nr:HPr family phosphocarrier protein [Spirochaetales bacterium]